MARNRELLSDKDFFNKTKHIIEHVRKCKIDITYFRDGNYVRDKKLLEKSPKNHNKHFQLNIATPAVKGIEKFTALNHELGHILMRSPLAEAKKLIKRWEYEYLENKGEHILEHDRYYNVFWNMFNVLEDQRIESLMGKLWLANNKRFRQTKRKLGKQRKKKITNSPVDMLLMVRFYRTDLVKDSKYFEELKKSLDDVECTGKYGALLQLRKLKPMIDEYMEEKDEKRKKLQKKLQEPESDAKTRETLREKLDELRKTDSKKTEHTPELSSSIEKQEEWDEMFEKLVDNDITENEFDDMQSELESEGDEELEDIKESMTGNGTTSDLTPSYVLRVNRKAVKINRPDMKLSKQLRNMFRKITEIHSQK